MCKQTFDANIEALKDKIKTWLCSNRNNKISLHTLNVDKGENNNGLHISWKSEVQKVQKYAACYEWQGLE